MHNEWNKVYEETHFTELPWETNKPDTELVRLLKEERIKKGRALDLGCGAGTHSIYLALQGFDVTGLDISSNAIKIARERAKKEKVNAKFVTGDACNLEFSNSSFGFVFDRGCFHHINKLLRERYFAEVHRVLKSKGDYLLMCFSKKNDFYFTNLNTFSLEDIRKLFSNHFKILETREIVHTEPEGDKVFLLSVFMEKI